MWCIWNFLQVPNFISSIFYTRVYQNLFSGFLGSATFRCSRPQLLLRQAGATSAHYLSPWAIWCLRVSLSSMLTFSFRRQVSQSWQLKWQTNHLHVVHTAAGTRVINCPILLSKVAQIKATHSKGMYSCLCYGLNNNRHGSDAFLVFIFNCQNISQEWETPSLKRFLNL